MSSFRAKLTRRLQRGRAATVDASSKSGGKDTGKSEKAKKRKSQADTSVARQGKPKKKKKMKMKNAGCGGAAAVAVAQPKLSVRDEMRVKLQGAQFRMLNEQLYTCSGAEALRFFQEEPEQFEAYHRGFRSQAEKWPVNPNDLFIADLRRRPVSVVVGDFGCGDARIAAAVEQRVHSFDLVAVNERVTACDVAHVPLEPESLDVAIFCLSLMGVNYLDYLREAVRVLKPGGELKIAEVQSRFEGREHVQAFVTAVSSLGCTFLREKNVKNFFTLFDFRKKRRGDADDDGDDEGDSQPVQAPPLKACRYKKR